MALSFTNPPTSSRVVNNTNVRASRMNNAPGTDRRKRPALALFRDTRPRIANRYFAAHQNRGKRIVARRMLVTIRYRNMRPVDRRKPPIPSRSSLNTCTAYPHRMSVLFFRTTGPPGAGRADTSPESRISGPWPWKSAPEENRGRMGQSSRSPIRRENPPNINAPFASPWTTGSSP